MHAAAHGGWGHGHRGGYHFHAMFDPSRWGMTAEAGRHEAHEADDEPRGPVPPGFPFPPGGEPFTFPFFGPPPGFGRGHGRGHGRRRRGFRGPRAGRGDVRAAVLALLAEQPMHGYQMIGELAERTGGAWRPSPGSVYPVLQMLTDEGLVRAEETDGRRVFHLTDAGRAEVEARGDAPRPWEAMRAESEADGEADLRQLVFGVGAAVMQVVQMGDDAQVEAAKKVLAKTRRSLYRILANEEEEEDES